MEGRPTITLLVGARAQFVALACATIVGRCGVSSPARVLAWTPSVVSELGRSWIAGASRVMGCTLHLPPSPHDPTFTIKMAHLFIGVSVTLGVVWCNCWDRGGGTDNGIGSGSEDSQGLGSHCWFGGVGAVISGNSGDLGDDRFVGLNDEAGGVCCVIDRRGRVLARLEGKVDKEAFAVIACNKKWVVRVETGESPSLMLWNVTRVMTPRCGDPPPVCNGVKVESIVHMRGMGAKFPRFNDPCGDEFALLGSVEGSMCISYVDLQKSIDTGVPVVTRRHLIPHPTPVDFLWDSPDTVVTMHQTGMGFNFYSTKTGILHKFPTTKYRFTGMVHPAYITARLTNAECKRVYQSTGSIAEIFRGSALEKPCSVIERQEPAANLPEVSTNRSLFATPNSNIEGTLVIPGKYQTSATIHDAITGTSLLVLTVTWS